jgi:alpha-beta hydrolase superfamily lysophospholipase
MSYHKPCLVLHGIEDEHRVPWVGVERDARAVARAGGSCALEALPGAGHDTLTADTFARIDAWLRVRWPD